MRIECVHYRVPSIPESFTDPPTVYWEDWNEGKMTLPRGSQVCVGEGAENFRATKSSGKHLVQRMKRSEDDREGVHCGPVWWLVC